MSNVNLKYLIIGFITLSILIIAGAYIYSLISKPIVNPIVTRTTEEEEKEQPLLPSLETEGKLNKLEGKQLILEKNDGSKEIFTLTDSTVFYKCSDFNNINSCTKDKNISENAQLKIYSKGATAVFLQYK